MKKLVPLLLCILLVCSLALPAFAEERPSLLTLYGNDMLFSMNKDIEIAGYASDGTVVTAELYLRGTKLAGGSAAASNGMFSVTLPGCDGGYDEYVIRVYANGECFRTLTGVMFGALWYAGGQSNMQYSLAYTREGKTLFDAGNTDGNIRVFDVPSYPEYNGSSENIPYYAQENIPGAQWYKGSNTQKLASVSAVAYFFAQRLRAELNVPVGILNCSLGGTSIFTWLSRETIDSDAELKQFLTDNNRYITQREWSRHEFNLSLDMTTGYNKKVYALRHFKPDGMIWYQGESDITSRQIYPRAAELLQKSYSELFGVSGQLPFVCTQLAAYYYGTDSVADFNIMLADFCEKQPDSRAFVSIYDIDTEWNMALVDSSYKGSHPIHPITKKPVGERLGLAALGLVYGKNESCSSPTVKSVRTEGNKVYITLKNTGDGLVVKNGGRIYGFAVAGENGVYVASRAQLTEKDTMCVWAESVEAPVSVSYASSQDNSEANLFASLNGEPSLPVSPFVTGGKTGDFSQLLYRTTCDFGQVRHLGDLTGLYPCFNGENAEVSLSTNILYDGAGALRVDYDTGINGRFFVSPVVRDADKKLFPDVETDYSKYTYVTFNARNDGETDIDLSEMRFYTSIGIWYSPAAAGSLATGAIIPADGEWHTVTLDLTSLCFDGNILLRSKDDNALGRVTDIRLCFGTDAKSSGTVYLDEFVFAASENSDYKSANPTFIGIIRLLFDWISSLFKSMGC